MFQRDKGVTHVVPFAFSVDLGRIVFSPAIPLVTSVSKGKFGEFGSHGGPEGGFVNVHLLDMRKLCAKPGERWPLDWPHEALELVEHLPTFGRPDRANFDDFHLLWRYRPVVSTGRFKVDNEAVSHTTLWK